MVTELKEGEIYYVVSNYNTIWILQYTHNGELCSNITIKETVNFKSQGGGFWNILKPGEVKSVRYADSEESNWLLQCIKEGTLVDRALCNKIYELW